MLTSLIVEDNPVNWMIMQNQLSKLGLQPFICHNGLEALEYCKKQLMPDLLLVDGYMPVMDGIEFIKQLRKTKGGDKPYIVFCSSSLEKEDIAVALELGANMHLPKPVDMEELSKIVSELKNSKTVSIFNSKLAND